MDTRPTLPIGAWALPLLVLAAALIFSNPWFTFIDDETWIVDGAAQPVSNTIHLYQTGEGEHEHPPLYDLMLHGWLRMTGAEMPLLRLPSIAFYVLGLWFLALAAARMAGPAAGKFAMWLGVLWPYGFHFGRLAAWYSLAFLLAVLLTHAYLRYLEAPGFSRWLLVFLASLALMYTNYYGWALAAFLALDFLWRSRQELQRRWPGLLGTALLLLVAYAPLWRAFLGEVGARLGERPSLVAQTLYAGLTMYALFVSESVAPWFWWLGVPAGIAVAVCLVIVLLRAPAPARRFFLYFCALFLLMIPLDILSTKRVMLIAPWLLLPLSATLAALQKSAARRWMVSSLAVVAALGWFGTVSRRFYAAPRFIEPWQEVARQAAQELRGGAAVIGNNPSFFFYLTYALDLPRNGPSGAFAGVLPETVHYRKVYEPDQWVQASRPVRPTTLLVKGVPIGGSDDPILLAQSWLDENCRLQSAHKFLPDPGYPWKQRYFPELGELPWRVEVRAYACPAPGPGIGGAAPHP